MAAAKENDKLYRVLLADDEPIILSGLQTFLPWEEYRCTVVGTARNGNQALEKIRQLQPDIVLCDIKIPVCGGLEVLNQAGKDFPEIVFIMLTNHDEFENVRESMRNKAADYLLKIDLDAEKLAVSLKMAIEERERRRQLHQARAEEELRQLQHTESYRAEETRKKEVARWISRLLSPDGDHPDRAAEELERLEAADNAIVVEMHITESNSARKSPSSRTEQQQNFHYRLVEELTEKTYYNVDHVLVYHDTVLWLYLWNLEGRNSVERFHARLTSALEDVALCRVSFLVTEIMPRQRISEFRRQLAVLQMEYASHPRPLIRYSPSLDKAGYVLEAKRYVENHIMERISVQTVAEAIGITPNYLSSLFKKQLGQNFVDYVNAQKVERACMLLSSGQYMIYKISHILGYDNAYYFAKVFKKHKQMTPSEWAARNNQPSEKETEK